MKDEASTPSYRYNLDGAVCLFLLTLKSKKNNNEFIHQEPSTGRRFYNFIIIMVWRTHMARNIGREKWSHDLHNIWGQPEGENGALARENNRNWSMILDPANCTRIN
jgi:hypothetical protein